MRHLPSKGPHAALVSLLCLAAIQEKVEVKGALRSDDADILSAYSSEQGADPSSLHVCLEDV